MYKIISFQSSFEDSSCNNNYAFLTSRLVYKSTRFSIQLACLGLSYYAGKDKVLAAGLPITRLHKKKIAGKHGDFDVDQSQYTRRSRQAKKYRIFTKFVFYL